MWVLKKIYSSNLNILKIEHSIQNLALLYDVRVQWDIYHAHLQTTYIVVSKNKEKLEPCDELVGHCFMCNFCLWNLFSIIKKTVKSSLSI